MKFDTISLRALGLGVDRYSCQLTFFLLNFWFSRLFPIFAKYPVPVPQNQLKRDKSNWYSSFSRYWLFSPCISMSMFTKKQPGGDVAGSASGLLSTPGAHTACPCPRLNTYYHPRWHSRESILYNNSLTSLTFINL